MTKYSELTTAAVEQRVYEAARAILDGIPGFREALKLYTVDRHNEAQLRDRASENEPGMDAPHHERANYAAYREAAHHAAGARQSLGEIARGWLTVNSHHDARHYPYDVVEIAADLVEEQARVEGDAS